MLNERISRNRGNSLDAFAFEKITVGSATAAGDSGIFILSTSSYIKTGYIIERAVITVSANDIRYLYDGTVPSTAQGHIIVAVNTLVLDGLNNISNFKCVRDSSSAGAAQAVLNITYEGFRA